MEWGILIVVLLLLFTGFVIMQATLAQTHWRGLVEQGDLEAIQTLIQTEIDSWRKARVPKDTPALLWHGVQTVELLDVTADAALVSCTAEGEYTLSAGRRVETTTPLSEGKKITKKLAEMLLYDVPNVKLDRAQIDVYTSFRDHSGVAEPRCILSTMVERSAVEHLDWEATEAEDFVRMCDGRFAETEGRVQPVEPLAWVQEASRRN